MSDMRGSRTEKHLLAAFAGECQASLRYAFYAKKAKKDGFEQISAIFQETGEQEKAHARRMQKLMDALEGEVTLPLKGITVGTTLENLITAVENEARVGLEVYPDCAEIAREEGFAEAALVFEHIARAERHHREVFQALADNVESGRVFVREAPVPWRCRHCGWVHEGMGAPERCPACAHPKAHFEVSPSNW